MINILKKELSFASYEAKSLVPQRLAKTKELCSFGGQNE
jgi:hypothetical protein